MKVNPKLKAIKRKIVLLKVLVFLQFLNIKVIKTPNIEYNQINEQLNNFKTKNALKTRIKYILMNKLNENKVTDNCSTF
jgi:hypothetical protein